MVFQKHHQNIASFRKKLDVLHDVLVLGTLFKAMTKAWLFSQKCNPEKLLHTSNTTFEFEN